MGAKLIQHGAHEVVFVLRPSSSNVAALREGGLKYRAVEEDDIFDLPASSCTVATTGELESVGAVDAVILCVKTFQVASSIGDLAALVGPKTVVISTQNGVEAHNTIAATYGQERTLCGVVRVLSYIESAETANGLVIRKNIPGSYHIGEIFPRVGVSPRVEEITAAMADAGIAAVAEPDILTNAWEKLVSSSCFCVALPRLCDLKAYCSNGQVSMACTGPVGGLARAPLKMIATVPQTRELLRAAMAEVVDVAASQGVLLDSNLEGALDRYMNGPVSPPFIQ